MLGHIAVKLLVDSKLSKEVHQDVLSGCATPLLPEQSVHVVHLVQQSSLVSIEALYHSFEVEQASVQLKI